MYVNAVHVIKILKVFLRNVVNFEKKSGAYLIVTPYDG